MTRPVRRVVKRLLAPVEALRGRFADLERRRNLLRSAPSIQEALETIESRWVALSASQDRPVFILSAGWRSGSTLLQRLALSGDDLLIWGEPYAHCDYIRHLAESLRTIRRDVPPPEFFIDHYEADRTIRLEETWVACLYPTPTTLLEAHRAFVSALYGEPARARGFPRWGLKEVRLGIEHARYLKALFPEARFIFLYRDPYDAYRSYRSFRGWYDRWPDRPVFTPGAFGAHWKRLLEGFLDGAERLGGRIVRYEDLVARRVDLDDLAAYLGTRIDPAVLDRKVTGRASGVLESLPVLERRLLRRAVEPLAGRLGYPGS